MAFAQGSRSRLSVAPEDSFGVLPGSPAFQTIPFKTHSLDLSKERLQGEDILSNRIPNVDRHGSRNAGGSIEVDLRRGDYDLFLESALFNEFDINDELVVGTAPRFLAIEDAALDITQFRQFSGMAVNTATFNMAPNQLVQTTFEMVGRDAEQAQTTLGAPAAAGGFEPFDTYNGEMFEGGTASGDTICNVSALQFSITNSLAPTFVMLCAANKAVAASLEFGRAVVEGTMTVYYEDAALIDKFLNETETSLSVTVDDTTGTNQYTFLLPRVKYNGASVPVANPQSRFIELPFVALFDSATDTNLKITRTAA